MISSSLPLNPKTLSRAQRAVRCSPFYMGLLAAMQSNSVALRAITDDRGMLNHYTRRPLSDVAADQDLGWLMAVGLIRREVDGQGLTDSFRLTPMGRKLVEQWEAAGRPDATGNPLDYLLNAKNRWLRLPTWLQ
ncbi:Npun_F0494 family protein [Leptothoe sp. PORK10 BA2]|uniref:Npun_F0494 family protein n=1 Tax=Leptothoe sp. PORK10 BA2 TaxID=3110254 RepID=UPI002B1F7ABA|nr:Npun_F0494 family protein [Leptothoe sp. PORK10 BA2]